MRDVTNRLYFVSTYRPEFSEAENFARLMRAQEYLKAMGLGSAIAEGHYENTVEKTLVVYADNNAERHILRIAEEYSQECYLVVYNDSASELVYVRHPEVEAGQRRVLGVWTQTEDRSLPGLTILNGKAYTIKAAA